MQHTAAINGKTILFLTLPEGATPNVIFNDKETPYYLPIGSWQILGKVDEITEEQKRKAIGGVDKYSVKQHLNQQSQYDTFWIVVNGKCEYLDTKVLAYSAAFNMEWEDLLRKERIFLANPYESLKPYFLKGSENSMTMEEHKKWQDAEKRTGNWIALIQTENK